MNRFRKNKIILESEAVSELLKKSRLQKKLSIKDVTEELKINQKYIQALENNEYDKMPPGVYGKNYLKEYAIFLGLDYKKILQIYNDEIEASTSQDGKNIFSHQVINKFHFLIIPRIIKSLIIVLVVVVLGVYLYLGFKNVTAPPELIILEPEDNITISDLEIDIKGQTEPESLVTINDDLVAINNNGFFEKQVNLKTGLNTIIIKSKQKYSRENVITRQILVKK